MTISDDEPPGGPLYNEDGSPRYLSEYERMVDEVSRLGFTTVILNNQVVIIDFRKQPE